MNQNFKIKMIAILVTISVPAIAPCFALQDTEQLDEPKTKKLAVVRPVDNEPSKPLKAKQEAAQIPTDNDRTPLPPIVTGAAKAETVSLPPIVTGEAKDKTVSLPPIVIGEAKDKTVSLPPIITGEAKDKTVSLPPIFVEPPIVRGEIPYTKPVPAPELEAQAIPSPPIVVAGVDDAFSVPENTPNSALPIPNAMPLSPLAPFLPNAEIASADPENDPETMIGKPRIPSDLILPELPALKSTITVAEQDGALGIESDVPTSVTLPKKTAERSVATILPIAPPAVNLPLTIAPETDKATEIVKSAKPEKQTLPEGFVEPVNPAVVMEAELAEPDSGPTVDADLKKIEKVKPKIASQIANTANANDKTESTKDVPREEISQAAKWNPRKASNTLSKAGVSIYPIRKHEPVVKMRNTVPPIVSAQNLPSLDSNPKVFVPEIVRGKANNLFETTQPVEDATAPAKNTPSLASESSNEKLPAIVQGSAKSPLAPIISPESISVPPSMELMQPEQTLIPPPKALVIKKEETSSPKTPRTSAVLTAAPPVTQAVTQSKPKQTYNTPSANPPATDTQRTRIARQTKAKLTYFNPLPNAQPAITSTVEECLDGSDSDCPDCGVIVTSQSNYAGCQSCDSGGCFDGSTVAARFGNSGSVPSASKYFIFDAIYLDRYDGTIAISNFGSLNNFENDLFGARVTIGRRQDAANGKELSYFGSSNLSETAFHTDANGRISAGFPSTGAFAIETTAFRNAVEQEQSKSTMFQSLEFNRNDWGWDVVRTFVGLRYIYIQDEYQISSRNLAGETGDFELSTQNNLLGGHLGYELFYDIGNRISWSTIGKFGIYANPNRVKTKLNNAGAQFLDLKDTNTALSGTIELGLNGNLKLGQRSRLRFGYNAFWLGEVASTANNIPVTINPTTGSDTSDSDDMFFHGLSVGLELFR